MLCRTTSLQVIILDQILHITVSNIIIFRDQHIAYFANWRSGHFFSNSFENCCFGQLFDGRFRRSYLCVIEVVRCWDSESGGVIRVVRVFRGTGWLGR